MARRKLTLLLTPIIVLTVAGTLADWFAAAIIVDHPLLEMFLNPRLRYLTLASNKVGPVAFFVVGFFRLVLTDPLFYLLGLWYGDAAMRWMERRGNPRTVRVAERWFAKAAYPIVFAAPNGFVCLLAGATGMPPVAFVALNVTGTVVRLVAVRTLAHVLERPLESVLHVVDRYQWWIVGVSVAIGLLQWWLRRRRRGEGPIDSGPRREPRVLLIRPDHLGDVLLTLPAAVAFQRAVPTARLTYLVASGLEPIPDRCPAISETLSLPFPSPDAEPNRPEWANTLAARAGPLRDRFDIAVLLRPDDPWSGALVQEAGIPIRMGFDRPGMRAFLTDLVPEDPGRHAVLLANDLLTAVFRQLDAAGLEASAAPTPSFEDRVLIPRSEDEAEAATVLAEVRSLSGERPIVLHPGTGWELKNWPPDRWAGLAAMLKQRFGVHPLVTGGADEQALVEEIAARSGGAAVPQPRALSLGGFAALLARAGVVVASDSGPLHLAAMVGAPVVGLYGPADPRLAAPWTTPERRRIVRIDLACSPCGVMYDPPCGAVRDPACVVGVGPESVLAAAEELLAARVSSSRSLGFADVP